MSLLDPGKDGDEELFYERFGGRPGGPDPTFQQVLDLKVQVEQMPLPAQPCTAAPGLRVSSVCDFKICRVF